MKLGLQIVLGLFSLIPLAFAGLGVFAGAGALAPEASLPAAVDNQFRYLSGVYLVVTLMLWRIIPSIEKHFRTLAILCAALAIGGVGRFLSQAALGPGLPYQLSGMVIELGAPIILIWQQLVARAYRQ